MGQVFAYARVSTDAQDLDPQADELWKGGIDVLVVEKASGASRTHPELARLVREMKVVRIDRLARSVSHPLDVIETLEKKGARFRSPCDPIDTTISQGMLSLQIQGAVAQLERALIADRSKAGLASTRVRGRVGGNPGVSAGDPAAIAKSMDETYVTRLIGGMEAFMPTVRKMRPGRPRPEVVAIVSQATGISWTVKRLRQSAQRLAAEGLVDRKVMGRAIRLHRQRTEELAVLVQGIALANPGLSLRGMGGQLEARKIRTPAGKPGRTTTSVAHLLKKAPGAPSQ